MPVLDLTNHRFGRLIARWPAGILKRRVHWLCNCRCGKLKSIATDSLRSGRVRSCGCLRREKTIARSIGCTHNIKHGHNRRGKKTREHAVWGAMIQRCMNPNHPRWKDYGGRGIKVCKRWRKFENFLKDMGPMPIGLSLDRFPDNDGDYKKSNCRWATREQQQRNSRRYLK